MIEGSKLGDADETYKHVPAPADDVPPAAALRGSVLAIDDDADLLEVVRAFLEPVAFQVHTTTDSEEALHIVAERSFDVVLCDLGMPKIDGLTLSQLLRQAGYRGKLVLMTGWDTDRVELDPVACDLLIKKPFFGAELIDAIRSVLTPAS